jgi:hypothetical protein
MKHKLGLAVIGCALLCISAPVNAQVTVTVDPGANWLGFMNVFELPSNGGGYVFGSGWGTADLVATFSGPVLTLAPNTIGDPNPFWYQGGGGPGAPGNKTMDANMYVEETGPLSGTTVTFTGRVLSNSLTSAHTSVAFIKDFAPDYSSNVTVTVPLTPGDFSVSLATNPAPGRHVQYGFETIGPNVWITDVGPFGSVQVTAIPEPATVALWTLGIVGLAGCARRRSQRARSM